MELKVAIMATADPLPECAPPPFIGVLDLFPQISWREGLPHGDEGGGGVHDKGRVRGLGPWQETASLKLEKATVQPGRWAGTATARSEPHGDVALGAERQAVSLSPKRQSLQLLCLTLLC